MRPSSISFVSVSLATSRRMPSKDESTTACGVSSMITFTPVRCSSARMLRPSRPMIRPFMSSEGSSSSETVVSEAWLAATRCSASATRLRARLLASPRAALEGLRVPPRLGDEQLPGSPRGGKPGACEGVERKEGDADSDDQADRYPDYDEHGGSLPRAGRARLGPLSAPERGAHPAPL